MVTWKRFLRLRQDLFKLLLLSYIVSYKKLYPIWTLLLLILSVKYSKPYFSNPGIKLSRKTIYDFWLLIFHYGWITSMQLLKIFFKTIKKQKGNINDIMIREYARYQFICSMQSIFLKVFGTYTFTPKTHPEGNTLA